MPGVLVLFMLSVAAVVVTTVVDIVRSDKDFGAAWGDFSAARWVAWVAAVVGAVLSFTSPSVR
ncbi:hypothetical protein [Cellulomonas sp. URHE0023]|uniref:hypothetical protein n=1 Tax=Cellulomonas sp. URHE0023 TaxID=1380354 RepID=UPI000484815B|nr:hypothetical protein [Cellulomonas sp. URHE0023]